MVIVGHNALGRKRHERAKAGSMVFIQPVGHKKTRTGHYEVQSNLKMTDSPLGRDKHKKHTMEEELS